MEARDSFCFPKNTKNPNPSPIRKKFGFCCCGAPPGTRTLGPLIKSHSSPHSIGAKAKISDEYTLFYKGLRKYEKAPW